MDILTQDEIKSLQAHWITIAPHELFDYAATCLELKGVHELTYDIPGFWGPDFDEGTSFEDSLQAHRDSYIIWK